MTMGEIFGLILSAGIALFAGRYIQLILQDEKNAKRND